MMDTTAQLPSQLALDAIQVLRERGHCKCISRNAIGNVCLVGALEAASISHSSIFGLTDRVKAVITVADRVATEQFNERLSGDPAHPRTHPSINMNNHPDTSVDEVIALLEKTAVSLMEEGK